MTGDDDRKRVDLACLPDCPRNRSSPLRERTIGQCVTIRHGGNRRPESRSFGGLGRCERQCEIHTLSREPGEYLRDSFIQYVIIAVLLPGSSRGSDSRRNQDSVVRHQFHHSDRCFDAGGCGARAHAAKSSTVAKQGSRETRHEIQY